MTTYRSRAALTAGAILSMSAGTAVADVTPTEVWTDWKAYMTDFGFAVSARETPSGSDLRLNDIVMSLDAPEGGADTEVKFPELSLTDNGDGTVSISFPESMPVSVAVEGPEPVSFDLIYTTSDLDMTVSGDASEMTYAYTAASVGVEMSDLVSEGKPVDFGAASIALQDVDGRTVTTAGDLRQSNQQIDSGPVTYEIAMVDPEDPTSKFEMTGQIDNLQMLGTATLPTDMDMSNIAAALAAGFAVDGSYTFGPDASTFTATEEGVVTRGTSASSGGELSVKMNEDGVHYSGTSNDLAIEMTVPDLPFPVSMAMAEGKFALDMPIAQKEAAQDFGLTFVLGDLTVSDAIWAMFDPAAQLPRDPATLALEMSGKARVMANLMDAAQMAAVEDGTEVPGELDALSLDRLLLRIAGAELTGEGAVTFDNTDKVTFDGMPKPIGDIGLKLTGANALLDKLVAMGFVPEEQVMGVRMMMGVFAVPGEGEDVLNSKIEFTEEGQILANGQRLK
ncbi:DUF2125 domain-containing protein [Roseovarius sp. M141]|uniref:DUF2125 domain-containing protein n=1 Tax=Roseovarius sp. M141 TaxID=2583806 RepID=UPI0020CD8764|nr:DUF2125 domain-containing protein [Roseovarius sp. M141]MCQ0091758.1 DUF2125 domain-containing protein [Roseovarius sp. M141]